MKVLEVIPSLVWKHKTTGRCVSPYGACPWMQEADKPNWELVQQGFTWRMSNGTIGLCRVPAATYEGAVEVMNNFNNRVQGS